MCGAPPRPVLAGKKVGPCGLGGEVRRVAGTQGLAPLRAPLAVTATRAGRMAPTGDAGEQNVGERLAAGGGISMSHLSVVKIGGEAGDFIPPLPRFLFLPYDCTWSSDVGTISVPPGVNRHIRGGQRDGWLEFDMNPC